MFGDSDPKREKVEGVCGGHVAPDGKKNMCADGQGRALSQEINTPEDGNMRWLSGVKNISGCVFTINVNNHYR